LFRRFVFDQFADGILDDVSGSVINATGFLYFRFVFDLRLMAFSEPNDFAEKLFVNLAENVRRQNRKFIWALGMLEAADNALENGIIDLKPRREVIRRLNAIFFFLKMEKPGVVTFVGFAKEPVEASVGVLAVKQRH
jgi:hypothetical protein